jgi:hypothetical protein
VAEFHRLPEHPGDCRDHFARLAERRALADGSDFRPINILSRPSRQGKVSGASELTPPKEAHCGPQLASGIKKAGSLVMKLPALFEVS